MSRDVLPSANLYGWYGSPSYYHDWNESARFISPKTPEPNIKELAREMWKAMFEFPVIIPCAYCNAMNAITNPTCIVCGAPMGAGYSESKKEYQEFGAYHK